MSKTLKTILFSLLGLVIAAVAAVLILTNSKLNEINYDVNLPDGEVLPQTEVSKEKIDVKGSANILLIGTDYKTEREEYARSDCMILASLNFSDGSVKLASLERAIPVDGNLLNAYYHFNGPFKLEQKVSELFDVPILGYASVDGSAFEKIVDAVGGIDVELSSEEAAAFNGATKSKVFMRQTAVKGINHLDGYDAYQYCRQRSVDSDFGRMDRQKKAIAAIISAVRESGAIGLNSAADSVLPLVHTNLNKRQIKTLLLQAPKFLDADVQTISIPQGWDKYGRVSCDFESETKRLHDFLGEEAIGAVSAGSLAFVEQEDPKYLPTPAPSPAVTETEQKPVTIKEMPIDAELPANIEVPVLLYYGSKPDNDFDESHFRLHAVSQIKNEVQYLLDNGYQPIWFEDLAQADGYDKPVILLFEGGRESDYKLVYPLAKELGFKFSIAPVVDRIDTPEYLTASEIKEMSESGLARIECMPKGDINLYHYDRSMIRDLYSETKAAIADITGVEPRVIAFPDALTDIAKSELPEYFRFGVGSRGSSPYNTSDSGAEVHPLYSQRGADINAFSALLCTNANQNPS